MNVLFTLGGRRPYLVPACASVLGSRSCEHRVFTPAERVKNGCHRPSVEGREVRHASAMLTEHTSTTCNHSCLNLAMVNFPCGPPRRPYLVPRRPSGLSSQLKIRQHDKLQLYRSTPSYSESNEQEIISIQFYTAEYIYYHILPIYIQVAPPAGRTWCGPQTAATPQSSVQSALHAQGQAHYTSR